MKLNNTIPWRISMEIEQNRKSEIFSEMLRGLMNEMKTGSGKKLKPTSVEVIHTNPQDAPLEFEAPHHNIDESEKDANTPVMDAATPDEEHDAAPGLKQVLDEASEADDHEDQKEENVRPTTGARGRLDRRLNKK